MCYGSWSYRHEVASLFWWSTFTAFLVSPPLSRHSRHYSRTRRRGRGVGARVTTFSASCGLMLGGAIMATAIMSVSARPHHSQCPEQRGLDLPALRLSGGFHLPVPVPSYKSGGLRCELFIAVRISGSVIAGHRAARLSGAFTSAAPSLAPVCRSGTAQ